ncbi:MAG: transcriptional repressor LexA [Oscillospiraceae bacterium]|nr:transcriptional repressor LexA [Oscillospiraceae bacterium]MBR4101109.1 transcriptional repressor LexA [Oscillospiraceae bacterium]MBR6616564.1 transcriptional repressor LexA [Oscillospiraceae bacterium]
MKTRRADEILAFIKDYIRTENMSPSVREICEGVGIRSTSTVHHYLHLLDQEGRIRMADGKNRAIVVMDEEETPGIPLVGTVAAGIPITAIENITDYVTFEPHKSYENPLFALRVRGESMINAGILDGDIVIVEQTPYAENGDIVVALVDHSEATVKTFFKEDGHYRLQPENDFMEPIIVEDVEILGKVVSLIRYF